jgi:hypothetical protein
MAIRSKTCLLSAALCGVLIQAGPLPAEGRNDEVKDFWSHYIRMVGCRDETEVIACYTPSIRKQLVGDNTAAGRARLEAHMADLFEILQRDWDHRVMEEKESGDKVTYTLKFRNRKDGSEYATTVEFTGNDGTWLIAKPPDPPGLLTAGTGTIPMVAGIILALGAIAFIGKKMLA